jgi:hypothetical protein
VLDDATRTAAPPGIHPEAWAAPNCAGAGSLGLTSSCRGDIKPLKVVRPFRDDVFLEEGQILEQTHIGCDGDGVHEGLGAEALENGHF